MDTLKYVPEQEEHSEEETLKIPKKRTKKAEKTNLNTGPTSRSRTNILNATNKDATDKEANDAPAAPTAPTAPAPTCSLQLPSNEGMGTMAAYLAMRNRQKKNLGNGGASGSGTENEKAIAENGGASGSGTTNDLAEPHIENEEVEDEAPKRLRGKTRMDRVHTRPLDKRPIIWMNDLKQPISDDDQNVCELGSFLGTLRRSVSLTYKNWSHVPRSWKKTMWNYVKQRYIIPDELEKYCIKSIRDSWRGLKSRTKKNHYLAYETDEERLANRPEEIPLEDFKMLMMYWADNDVEEKAKKNAVSRRSYTDTHTAGPKTFAQIKTKLPVPSDAAVFVKTRKRKPGRKYKSDTAEKIEKAMAGGDSNALDELVCDGKSHGPSWLKGRHVKFAQVSTNAPTSTYVQELIAQIKQNLVDEMEVQVNKKVQEEVDSKLNRKVQENMTWLMKKLGEANPGMKIDLGELCATISTDNENGTPVTIGTSS